MLVTEILNKFLQLAQLKKPRFQELICIYCIIPQVALPKNLFWLPLCFKI